MERTVQSKLKCPKCKCKNLLLIEVWHNHEITWEQEDGRFDRSDGNLEMGDAHKVEAECRSCGYHWTSRGALQIDDIIKD